MKNERGNTALIVLFAGMTLILIITMLFGNEKPVALEPTLSGKELSYNLCKIAITQTAHDPSSVEFSGINSVTTVMELETRYILNIPVRAKNGFNALRMNTIECITDKKNKDWSLTNLRQLEDTE